MYCAVVLYMLIFLSAFSLSFLKLPYLLARCTHETFDRDTKCNRLALVAPTLPKPIFRYKAGILTRIYVLVF